MEPSNNSNKNKHRRTKTTSAVAGILSSSENAIVQPSLKRQRSEPENMSGATTHNPVDMDKLFMSGLRKPHSSSSQQLQQQLQQHLSRSVPQHLNPAENNIISNNLNNTTTSYNNTCGQSPLMTTSVSALPQQEFPVSNHSA